ncbi:TonB-dependent receptor [Massilia psychrophila]|uniref:TonB-dependent receptor n=1 Tax=Massilia psychrophila TaxID=1603353 RepID=UPI0015D51A47|nr:TonB-dependent receptor [Massilia psychrophila]GGE68887.1 TonB-dependent receptor [Massilia psychrophila]
MIQDVPGAVSSISGAELEKQAMPDITAVANLVPSTTLKVSRGTNTTLTAFIRGIGQQDPVAGYEPGVGIYLDDVYMARPQGALTDIYDLERVEILRGPQGTLYGKNTIGGAVKYVTRKLSPKTTFGVKATVGNYGEKDLVLNATVPLSDMLRIGGSVATFNRDGFGQNVVNGKDNYNKEAVAGRISIELTPSSNLFIRLSSDRTVDDSQAKQGYRLTPGPAPASLAPLENKYDTRANLYAVNGHAQQVITQGTALLAEYQVNPELSFKSVTAYRKSKSFAPIDFDSLGTPLFEAPTIYADNQKSQEFQLTYTGAKIQGVAGVFYMKANAFNEFDVLINFPALGGLAAYTMDDINSRTKAVFADVSYSVTDTFNVNVGGRYTDDQHDARIFKRTYIGLAGSPTLGNPAAAGLSPANTDLGPDALNRTDTKFTPKLGFGWKFAPQHNMYGTASQGFKGGMFDPRMDLTGTGGPNTLASQLKRKGVNPEEVTAFELGLKSSMNGGRLQTNAAVFFTKYKNVQIPGSIITYDAAGNANGFSGSLTNAGKAKIKGLELEAISQLTNSLNVSGMYSYIDAKYDEWLVANGPNLINLARNAEFQNTPKHSGNLSASYDWPLVLSGRSGMLSLMNGVSYKSRVYQTEIVRTGNTPGLDALVPGNLLLAQDAYTLWDASLVWTSADRKVQVGLHGRNLTDKRYKVAGYNFSASSNTVTAFYGDPRTVKATVSLKF